MLKYLKIILSLPVIYILQAAGQQGPYTLTGVPDSIKKGAAVIVQYDRTDVEIMNPNKMVIKVDRIITVPNDDGKHDLLFKQFTSGNISLEDAEIRVFDASGKQIQRIKKKEMRSEANGEGLIEDGAVTHYYVTPLSYPLTVEYKYEISCKGTLNIPGYYPVMPRQGVIESVFTIRVPASMGFRYKPKHCSLEPSVSNDGDNKLYSWQVRNLPPPAYETGATSSIDAFPNVQCAVDRFSYYGIPGNMASWKDFGNWFRDLYNGTDALPPDRQQFFNDLVKGASSDREKIARLYDYLQHNFRYVSIQLGIGGFKPLPADFTDKKKYGDCKGLTNLMRAALKSVGIRSYPAIINSDYDQEPVDPDFPSNNFDHVILCVPQANDTVWLECTSSTNSFNELGPFTENRYALLVTEDGGALVPTPASKSSENRRIARTDVKLDENLSAETETMFTCTGEYAKDLQRLAIERSDVQKSVIVNYLGARQPDEFDLTPIESSAVHKTRLKMSVRKMSEFSSGDKLFITPRVFRIWVSALPKSDNRKLDFYFDCPFENTDTTIFHLPVTIKPDVLPQQTSLACKYASVEYNCWYDEKQNTIYSTSKLVLSQHRIPAGEYAPVKQFFDQVMQLDAQKLVVKKDQEKKSF